MSPLRGRSPVRDVSTLRRMSTTSLAELAEAAAPGDQASAIQFVLDNVSPADSVAFLRGLTERILVTEANPDDDRAAHSVSAWLGSWLLSCLLENSQRFLAADTEAEQLIAAGKIGTGITGAELRQRYHR